MSMLFGDVDVASGVGLRRALEAVAAEPGGWESGLGVVVARAVVAELVRRVGRRRLGWMVSRLAGVDEVRGQLAGVVLDVLMLRPEEVETAGEGAVWGWLVRRCVWEMDRVAAEEALHGLAGDSRPQRLRARLEEAGVTLASLDDEAVEAAVVMPLEAAGAGRVRRYCGVEDLGPVLGALVGVLEQAGVPGGVAAAGTARVAELAASWRASVRHTQARQDARGGGVLAGLGVGEDAASAWMSLVAGSKKLGAASSLVLALSRGEEVGAGRWAERHGVWVSTVVAGVAASGQSGYEAAGWSGRSWDQVRERAV